MELIDSDATHPLSNLDEQITQASTRQGDYDFGAHFYGYGKGIVKGGNLSFYRRQEEGKEFVELEFKVNNYALPHLRQCATQNTKLHSNQPLTTEEANQLLEWIGDDDEIALHGETAYKNNRTLTTEEIISPEYYRRFLIRPRLQQQKIQFQRLGEVRLAIEPENGDYPNHFRKVTIRVDQAELSRFRQILENIGLQDVLTPNEQSDEERIKIGQLFRAFYPREALDLERSAEFYQLPIPQLKQKIISLVPAMENIFQDELPRMGKTETLPGKKRHTIPLANKFKGIKLRHALMSYTNPFEQVENVLKFGLLSREVRTQIGMNSHGIGGGDDESGSNDSVFVQAMDRKELLYDGDYPEDIYLVIDKKTLNTVTYQYNDDCCGNRISKFGYSKRPSIHELLSNPRGPGHEIMVKDRIPPEMIKKIVVKDGAQRRELINHLVASKAKEEGISESNLNFYHASLEKMVITEETLLIQRIISQAYRN